MFRRATHVIKQSSSENPLVRSLSSSTDTPKSAYKSTNHRSMFQNAIPIHRQKGIKHVLAKKIVEHQKRVNEFVTAHGNKVIDRITVDQVYGGMRGAKVLVTETSHLDPDQGIHFRGVPIFECCKRLPKAPNGDEPLPEGVFYLLLTGDFPDQTQVNEISKYWADHADLPTHIVSMLNKFPSHLSPMSQFSAAITACNTESLFVKAYADGVPKTSYWEYVLEDSMRIIAKLPTIAAIIYRNLYRNGSLIGAIDPNKDWSENFTSMLGFNNQDFTELIRFHLTIHSDHEGGNVSSHTAHLVNSTLSDPYLSLAAGMNGLAGPLHGLATQEVLMFIDEIIRELGSAEVSEKRLDEFVRSYLKSGRVIPGFGHAVLKRTDPRYSLQREFALKHLPEFPKFKLVSQLYKIVPKILQETGKVKNPWPNVDAHSGVLLQFYGLKEARYYTVLVGMSRALGVLSSLVWDRALSKKIVNPSSVTSDELFKLFQG